MKNKQVFVLLICVIISLSDAISIQESSSRRKTHSMKLQRRLKTQSNMTKIKTNALSKAQRHKLKLKTQFFKKYSTQAVAKRVQAMSETERVKFKQDMESIAAQQNVFAAAYNQLNPFVDEIKEHLQNPELLTDPNVEQNIETSLKGLHEEFKKIETKDATLKSRFNGFITYVSTMKNIKELEQELEDNEELIKTLNEQWIAKESTLTQIKIDEVYKKGGNSDSLPVEYKKLRRSLDSKKSSLEKNLNTMQDKVKEQSGKQQKFRKRQDIIFEAITDSLPPKFCYRPWMTSMVSTPDCPATHPEYKKYYDVCSETCQQGARRHRKNTDVIFSDSRRNQDCYETCDLEWPNESQKQLGLYDVAKLSTVRRKKDECQVMGWSIYEKKEPVSWWWAYTIGLFDRRNNRPLEKFTARKQQANTKFTCNSNQHEWWGMCFNNKKMTCTDYGMNGNCGLFGCASSTAQCVSSYVDLAAATVLAAAKTTALILTAGSSTALHVAAHVIQLATIVSTMNGLLQAWKDLLGYYLEIWEVGGTQLESVLEKARVKATKQMEIYNTDNFVGEDEQLAYPDLDEMKKVGELLYEIKKNESWFDLKMDKGYDIAMHNKLNTAYQNLMRSSTLLDAIQKEATDPEHQGQLLKEAIKKQSVDFVRGKEISGAIAGINAAITCGHAASTEKTQDAALATCAVGLFKSFAAFDPSGISQLISSLIYPFCSAD